MVHAIRSQGWVAGCADKSLNHSGRVSSKQISKPDITSLYPANTEVVRSWVRGKRAWSRGGEGGKPILGFLLGLFWGIHPAGMTYHPKEARMSWDQESTHTVAWQVNKQNSLLCLVSRPAQVSGGSWQTNKWSERIPRPDKGC